MLLALLGVSSFGVIVHAETATQSTTVTLGIEPQPLGDALNAFAQQAGLQIVFVYSELAQATLSRRLEGRYSPQAALDELLANTEFRYEFLNDRTVEIRRKEASATRAQEQTIAQERSNIHALQLAKARTMSDSLAPADNQDVGLQRSTSTSAPEGNSEITVTGSHIRGTQHSASQILTFNRESIERAGYSTAEQFIQSLPQNFSGGISAGNLGGLGNIGGEDAGNNFSLGTGINLRGLGGDSTLVLVNGRRLATSSLGDAVDISVIPLSAVERIDVLPDGASAVYGSDAVAGVVNLVLRTGYSGAESRLRYGTADGDMRERQLGQVFGLQHSRTSALLSYEYHDRSALSSQDRSYTQAAGDPSDLLGEDRRHSVFASAAQSISDHAKLYANGLYSRRTTDQAAFSTTLSLVDAKSTQYGSVLGAQLNFGQWHTDFAGSYNRNETLSARNFTALGRTAVFDSRSDVLSFDAIVNGVAFNAPGGQARVAVGGQARDEGFFSHGTTNVTPQELTRKAYAVFGELLVPIIDESQHHQMLEVTVAGRYEHYEDFGSSSDPKIGILWAPTKSFRLRGTYSTAFRAPRLYELSPESFSSVLTQNLADPTIGGALSPTIVIRGNNAQLNPEESASWSVGMDLSPVTFAAFNASLTYFNIDFKNRIAQSVPEAIVNSSVFFNEAQYQAVIRRNPSTSDVTALFATPGFFNLANVTPSQVRAIVDDRLNNTARRRESGVDLTISHETDTAHGRLNSTLAATRLLKIRDQVTPTSPFVDLLNMVYYPPNLRARAGLGWTRSTLGANIFVNHTSGYDDPRPLSPTSGPAIRGNVSSWTTADLQFSSDLSSRFSAAPQSVVMTLNAQNVFDRDPPFVPGAYQYNFDPANANAIGRLVSLQLIARW